MTGLTYKSNGGTCQHVTGNNAHYVPVKSETVELTMDQIKLIFETGRNYQLTGDNNLNELLESFKLSTPTPEPEK